MEEKYSKVTLYKDPGASRPSEMVDDCLWIYCLRM